MEEITIKIKIYDIENIEKYKKLFDSKPMFFFSKGEVGAIWGDHTYDFEIADFLKAMPLEEINKLKKLAEINVLKKKIEELEKDF